METTRSAISCLSSSTCSPIRGIELSITCRRKEKRQLVRRFPGARCLFQLTSHTNLLCVSTFLPTPLVTTPLHTERRLTFLGMGFHLGGFFWKWLVLSPTPPSSFPSQPGSQAKPSGCWRLSKHKLASSHVPRRCL